MKEIPARQEDLFGVNDDKADDADTEDTMKCDLCTVSAADLMPVSIPETRGLREIPPITVDSGAAQSVMNPKHLPGIPLEPSEWSRKGLKYQGPGKELIPNLGQMCVSLMTIGGMIGRTTWQAADVRKPLMAVSAINDKENMVIFDLKGSGILPGHLPEVGEIRRLLKVIQDRKDGIDLERSGGVFTMRAWRTNKDEEVFAGQGRLTKIRHAARTIALAADL